MEVGGIFLMMITPIRKILNQPEALDMVSLATRIQPERHTTHLNKM